MDFKPNRTTIAGHTLYLRTVQGSSCRFGVAFQTNPATPTPSLEFESDHCMEN